MLMDNHIRSASSIRDSSGKLRNEIRDVHPDQASVTWPWGIFALPEARNGGSIRAYHVRPRGLPGKGQHFGHGVELITLCSLNSVATLQSMAFQVVPNLCPIPGVAHRQSHMNGLPPNSSPGPVVQYSTSLCPVALKRGVLTYGFSLTMSRLETYNRPLKAGSHSGTQTLPSELTVRILECRRHTHLAREKRIRAVDLNGRVERRVGIKIFRINISACVARRDGRPLLGPHTAERVQRDTVYRIREPAVGIRALSGYSARA
ncbi:hypothetical protein BJY52DRAFT_1417830 [Lactarius psammicola]|nr:hypothetical protein BJY52DRAFT_1417830 [Lactarius psammicola]